MTTPTLGWLLLDWMHEHLPSPSDPTAPLVLSEPQAEFVIDFYSFDPETLEFTYRRGAWMAAKGTGKSPLGAVLAIAEFAGPVLVDGFDANGEPVGRPWGVGDSPAPWAQIAAVAEEQAQSNIYSILYEMLTVNDGKAAKALGIDEGRTRLFRKDRPASKLEAVTSAAGTREGQRVTFAVCDESHLWTPSNGGTKLARTIRRNAGKVGGRTVELANAPELGERSVAEDTMDAASAPEVLFRALAPSREPDPEMDDEDLAVLLEEIYAVPWVDTGRILREVRDPSTPWEEAKRFYFNIPESAASVLAHPSRWAELGVDAEPLPEGARIGLGFDGSYSQDGTSIVACTEDGLLVPMLLIEREPTDPPDWRVPRKLVHEELERIFDSYEVARMLCDPYRWGDEVDLWSREYGEDIVLSYPTNSVRRFGPAVDRFLAAVAEGRVRHERDADLTRHVLNARLVKGRGAASDEGHALFTLEKGGPGRLIDAAVASVLAYEAIAQAGPAEPKRVPLVAFR